MRNTMIFLNDATPATLLRAVAANHVAWFARRARAAGGELLRQDGTTWAYAPSPAANMTLLFPRLARSRAGAQLDEILAFCRRHGVTGASCWSLIPPRPRDLGAWLVARGFGWGWQPHWMALYLPEMRTEFAPPPGLRIDSDDGSVLDVEQLPYYNAAESPQLRAAIQARPQRIWHFVARLEGRVVGHSALNLTTGRLGVAGIFDCGVVPDARNQGMGKAVTAAACRQARDLGCRYALLNATPMGEPVYRRLGFVSLGWGQTWWMHRHAFEAPPSTTTQAALAEAIGRGDLRALDPQATQIEPGALDAPLISGMTLMDLAVKMRQPRSAEWLAAHGATLDLLTAWDLGWKERLPALLSRDPALINRRGGELGATPLHEAVYRNDVELVRTLLAAHPDLDAKDTQYQSTPLGWARHLGRPEIIPLLEERAGR